MNKRQKSNVTTGTTTAVATCVTPTAWRVQIAQLNTDALILVHILSFVCAKTDTARLVCKKWAKWGHYATFHHAWSRYEHNSENCVLMQRLQHVVHFEPQMALRSPLARDMIRCACKHGGNAETITTLLDADVVDKDFINSECVAIAMSRDSAGTMRALLNDVRTDPTHDKSWMLRWAVASNSINVTAVLLADRRASPAAADINLLQYTVQYGYNEITRMLLEDRRCAPSDKLMRKAVEHQNPSVLALLLADGRCDPAAKNHYALRYVARYGDLESMRLLMADGRSDPTVDKYRPILWTAARACEEGVQLLMRDSRVDNVALLALIDDIFYDTSPSRHLLLAAMSPQ